MVYEKNSHHYLFFINSHFGASSEKVSNKNAILLQGYMS